MMADETRKTEYCVGDRVILNGLQKAAHLNNRHGTVAGPLNENGRYPIDLDLLDPSVPHISAKPVNLKSEPPLPDNIERASAQNGVLTQDYGRPLSHIFEAMRYLVGRIICNDSDVQDIDDVDRIRAMGPVGLARINQYMALGWSHWLDPGGFYTPAGKGIYEMLRDWVKMHVEDLEAELAKIPKEEVDALNFIVNAMDNPAAVKGWNVRIHGDFWVVGMDDEGTFLVPAQNRTLVYRVLGVRSALYAMVSADFPRPVKMRLTMVPFMGRLIYDGVVSPGGNIVYGPPPMASSTLASKLKDAVEKAKAEGRIVDRLRQLEVPGGSLEGLPTQGMNHTKTHVHDVSLEQPPATPDEAKWVEEFRKFSPFSDMSGEGLWVFRRCGYTEHENPEHAVAIMCGKGLALNVFQLQKLEPTSVEILKEAVNVSRKQRKRPGLLCIDDEDCFQRVKFLLKDVGGTNVRYYMPPTPEETHAAMVGPPGLLNMLNVMREGAGR